MEYDNKRHNPLFNTTVEKDKLIHYKCKEARGTGWLSMNGLCVKKTQLQLLLFQLPNISHLYLSGCRLKGKVPSFTHVPKLQVLDLSDNALSGSLPYGFDENKDMKVIDFSMNKFTRFPAGICNLKSLKELNLAQNELVSITEDVAVYVNLEILDVSYNLLRTLPDSLCTSRSRRSLKILRLRNNVLSELPSNIGSLNSLEELDLRDNDLSYMPPSVKKLTNLQTFHHKGNRWVLAPIKGKYGYNDEPLDSSYGSQALRSLYELLLAEGKHGTETTTAQASDSAQAVGDSSDSSSLHIESLL